MSVTSFNPLVICPLITDLNFLVNYCDHYIEKLQLKTNDKTGELGASIGTIKKYKRLK